jgi:DNA-binding transcriptional LysR family regulator
LFLEHARAGLLTLQEGVQAVRSQDKIVRGRLHLGILQSLEPYYVDLSFYAVVNKAEWPGLRVIPYAQDSLVAVCSRDHRLAAMKSVRLAVLAQETFVDLTSERALRKLTDQVFALHHLRRSTVFEVSDVQTALRFVGRGLGVAIMPSALARSSANARQIHSLRIMDRSPQLPKWRIAIITRSRQKVLPGKSTVDLFLESLANLPKAFEAEES